MNLTRRRSARASSLGCLPVRMALTKRSFWCIFARRIWKVIVDFGMSFVRPSSSLIREAD
jgi:hypothetical protein